MSIIEESIFNELNENIDGDLDIDLDNNRSDEEGKDPEPGSGVVVEKKKRVTRTKQFRLNIELLKGPRGIHTIENYFKDIKFKGKYHEKEDLDEIMKKLGYWAHRLYPKYSFDDSINTIENLGRKRALQTHLIKYRQNMLDGEVKLDAELIEADKIDVNDEEPVDEMDALLDQQIALSKLNNTTNTHNTSNNLFDSIRDEDGRCDSFNLSGIAPVSESTNTTVELNTTSSDLTEEQKAKIAENRRLALERLQARKNSQLVN